MSNFMQHQVTGLQNWVKVETTHSTEFIDSASLSLFVRNSDCLSQPLTDDEREQTIAKIQPYVEGTPQSWENIKGYGARLSAPGYLDCTEWNVFETEQEAREYLEENYSEDDEDEPILYACNGGIELSLTLEQARSASHSGQCDEDVKALSLVPEVAEQLARVDTDALVQELKEYGAWDAEELADHENNLQRLLWCAACSIAEENR
jgi:hypothetical protein